jgi:PTH1 family peptidyl-tRNA hydrolase
VGLFFYISTLRVYHSLLAFSHIIFAHMKYLVVGLGNIGMEYDATRHNIGFDVADSFVIKHGGTFKMDRHAYMAQCKWKGKTFIVIKPTTYMNLSGKAMKYWLDKENIPVENSIVIVDDLALPLETLRLRASGSDAGHNGLKSIQDVLQTTNYPRLRFCIVNDYPKGMQIEFVLGKWQPSELPVVKEKILKSIDIIESFAAIGVARTMSLFNN